MKTGPNKSESRDTAEWTRNASDVHAVEAGCWLSVAKGAHAVWWIERHCRLYEGEHAGEALMLRGCHQCGNYGLEVPDTWEEAQAVYLERARRYARCVKARHPVDWQFESTMRFFAWLRFKFAHC